MINNKLLDELPVEMIDSREITYLDTIESNEKISYIATVRFSIYLNNDIENILLVYAKYILIYNYYKLKNDDNYKICESFINDLESILKNDYKLSIVNTNYRNMDPIDVSLYLKTSNKIIDSAILEIELINKA